MKNRAGWRGLGNEEKARPYLERILKELPETAYAKRAKQWMEAAPGGRIRYTCIGCHIE